MKGLELARQYYDMYGSRFLAEAERLSPGLSSRLSVGLVGEGSQCFGFDDEISRDHDFAPGFCVFLSDADYQAHGQALQSAYNSLPDAFLGFSRQNILARERLGVINSSEFYGRFTGIPVDELDWLFLPESALATAVNGEIWQAGCEEFQSVRRLLQEYYPEDVRRKKIAARAAVLSQAGQYNLLRVIRRQDEMAALFSLSQFAEAAISMVHLLARQYTPFYKWAFRSLLEMSETDSLAKSCCQTLEKLPDVQILLRERKASEAESLAFRLTESLCGQIAEEFHRQNLSRNTGAFLQDHLPELMAGITHPKIRAMHPMADPAV